MPEDVRRFLLHAVPSVPHLEALLLLRGEPDRSYPRETLAALLYLSPQKVEAIADELVRLGLAGPSGSDAWIYRPESDEKRQTVDRLAEYYRLNVVRVSQLLHAKPDRHVLEFSDVFRLRKDR